jgi:hypothetical protein
MREAAQRVWIILALALACTLALLAQEIKPRLVGDTLRISAKGANFLQGKQLDALRNGATVTFDLQLTLVTDLRSITARGVERFVFSYDIWEERYSVVQLTSRASAANLTLDAAQQWCVDRMGVNVAAVGKATPHRLRLEIRGDEPRRRARRDQDDPPIALATLVDIFSRPARVTQKTWLFETGMFRLDSLK